MRSRPSAGLIVLVLLALVPLVGCKGPTDPVGYASAPLASWRAEGIGHAVLLVGDVVYVGGEFATVVSPDGAQRVDRANLAAFDARTGALLDDFQADTNGPVRALATDGVRLFVGGSFTTVGGVGRSRLAAVDPVTGAVDLVWSAPANSNVYGLAVGAGRLHVAGSFSVLGGESRSRLGALDAATGALTSWAPAADATVSAIATDATGANVYVGGAFTTVAGVASPWLAALDAGGVTRSVPWVGLDGPAIDLDLSADGTRLAAAQAGAGNQASWYDTATGARLWYQRCDGDIQAVAVVDGTVVAGGHEACEGDATIRLVANAVEDGARDLGFVPAFDLFWGTYALDGDRNRLVAVGDFTSVSGVPAQGFAIIPSRSLPAPGPVAVSMAATWRYWDQGTAPDPGWTVDGFDDGAWGSGPAQLGYGDGDEATVVSFGPSESSKYLTTWFRTTFTASAPVGSLTLRLLADDGALVRLNGVEVARDNLPEGPITPTTRAVTGRSGDDESVVRTFVLPPGLVVTGTNVLAVEVHQDRGSSSDLSFAAGLTSTPAS